MGRGAGEEAGKQQATGNKQQGRIPNLVAGSLLLVAGVWRWAVTGFAVAVERRQWSVVALYLLLGVSEAAQKLPPQTLIALVDLLSGDEDEREGARDGGR